MTLTKRLTDRFKAEFLGRIVAIVSSAYLHRLNLDWRFDATSTYTEKMDVRTRVVEYLFDNRSAVNLE